MRKFTAAIAICGLLVAANLVSAQALQGSFPPGGGPITMTNTSGATVATNGVDFASASGGLQFVSAAPYTFPLLQTPNAVTLAVIPGSVDYAAGQARELGVNYTGGGTALGGGSGDLTANYGVLGSPQPVAFPVNAVPEPATGLLATFAGLGLLAFRRRR